MLKEIMEQKHTIKRAIETNKESIQNLANQIKKKKKVYFMDVELSLCWAK